jgi:hypothetical protein
LDETTQQIVITSPTNSVTTAVKSNVARIEIDKATGKPIGAEFVEYKDCKNVVKYDNIIYISGDDLVTKLSIRPDGNIGGYKWLYTKNNKEAIYDSEGNNSHIYVDNKIYYNVDTFKDLIGE